MVARMRVPEQVRLRYSEALATLDIGHPRFISVRDAWHPSRRGHGLLADAIWKDLEPSLEFLDFAR